MENAIDEKQSIKPKLGLFGGYGIELEYMIVDKATLGVRPISDQILRDNEGRVAIEVEKDQTCWSNELVMHVVELKSNGPTSSLKQLQEALEKDIRAINRDLGKHHSMLLPTAMHPFFDPMKGVKLWSFEANEIYDMYNKIFDCKGHGWSNLQSMHINLPFANNEEFSKLHAAIRIVLPLLPALAASSPIFEKKHDGFLDQRLEFYRKNQAKVPELTGDVIPEQAFSIEDYHEKILKKCYKAISPYDPNGLLQEEWLNSRGAIARFDRYAIEIRVIDIQECPRMDLAIASFVISWIKSLVDGRWIPISDQKMWSSLTLGEVFKDVLKSGDLALIRTIPYLRIFDRDASQPVQASQLLKHVLHRLLSWGYSPVREYEKELFFLVQNGCLSRRILQALQPIRNSNSELKSSNSRSKRESYYPVENLKIVYQQLASCLQEGKWFEPNKPK